MIFDHKDLPDRPRVGVVPTPDGPDLKRVPRPDDPTLYVEARVGSQNHRGDCVRVLWRDGRSNEPAERVVRDLAADRHRLLACLRMACHHLETGIPITPDSLDTIRTVIGRALGEPGSEEPTR